MEAFGLHSKSKQAYIAEGVWKRGSRRRGRGVPAYNVNEKKESRDIDN